ncbi:MAG TPA: DUF3551 domain-containing protein [Xanthobacteraceae bacterium]|jgi:Protein of unknown function (DUF3551)|nr:DUF3551 domain-containing protein [Xanthobacteraceae bacterium]
MRYAVLAAALLAAIPIGTASAQMQGGQQAQGNEPYCAQSRDGNSTRCLFRTMDQCEEALKGAQSQYGSCIQNPKPGKM